MRSLSATIVLKIRRCASRKKSRAVDELRGVIERVVVDQDRAEDGFLGVEAVREGTFGGDVRHRRETIELKNSRLRAKRSTAALTPSRSPDRRTAEVELLALFGDDVDATCAVTSRWTFTGTTDSPSALSGSGS